jgi:ABC-type nickel/cobalt efflux system permease component RcnA
MSGIDHRIATLGHGGSLVVLLAVALLLGLRHASDPDHLTAVSTLIASERRNGIRRAARLGLAWGAGHASTLVLFGLPIVLFKAYLPDALQRITEAAVGVVIVALAVRLLVRWRQGRFHTHAHRHGSIEHRHLHDHETAGHEHVHAPTLRLGRSPREAYAIGLVHGAGGSAGLGILLLAGISDKGEAAAALLVFALATATSMTVMSSLAGWALTRGPVLQRALVVAPVLGVLSLTFGVWYVVGVFAPS